MGLKQIHLDRWAELLVYQGEIKPFSPTLDEIAKLWGFASSAKSSSPLNTLEALERHGYVVSRQPFPRCKLYFAVDPMESNVPA
jgi:hypothetical protein